MDGESGCACSVLGEPPISLSIMKYIDAALVRYRIRESALLPQVILVSVLVKHIRFLALLPHAIPNQYGL